MMHQVPICVNFVMYEWLIFQVLVKLHEKYPHALTILSCFFIELVQCHIVF